MEQITLEVYFQYRGERAASTKKLATLSLSCPSTPTDAEDEDELEQIQRDLRTFRLPEEVISTMIWRYGGRQACSTIICRWDTMKYSVSTVHDRHDDFRCLHTSAYYLLMCSETL